MSEIRKFSGFEDAEINAAEEFIATANKAIKKNGRFTVALSGGITPRGLYALLSSDDYRTEVDWMKVFFFFGDERDVSPMSDQSNYQMARQAIFKPLEIPDENIFHWRTEIINPMDVARTYQKTIVSFFELGEGEFPKFDLVLLGLGEDGHTASLFPNSSALAEENAICTATYVERLDVNRLTFTFPTINSAEKVMFIVFGEEKADAVKEVLEGAQNIVKFPAQGIDEDKAIWILDSDAAGDLS
ncbi:MAG: 6-phosphogluconolactonase [Pyrinomonadaceae bacterium]